ncbi:uncharacterized protein BDV14DRAFT_172481 [Aspergillus stella-maris]|uniref:uncharacterized protein n=1 Tax=Aspergillus stella-maris TaxID=1810926 RepID=UPI003CCD3C44
MPVSTRTSKFPLLQIMSGSCLSPVPVGILTIRCPCKGFTGMSKDGQLDIICEACLHPLAQHGVASSAEVDSTQKGSSQLKISSILDQYLSPRSETVLKLADFVDSQKVVYQHYKVMKKKSVLIETWDELKNYPLPGHNSHPHAWGNLDRMLRARVDTKGLDIRICLFCCYGSPLSGVDRDLDTDISTLTPAHFNPVHCVTLTAQSMRFTLLPDAEDYLFLLTNKHPGGLSSVLKYIHNFYYHDLKSRNLSVILKEHVVDSLKWDKDVWDMLAHEPISRSLPQGSRLTTEVESLLAKVLEEGNVPCESNKAVETCYKCGWLHKMQMLGEDYYKWIKYYITKSAKSIPSEFQNLQDLTLAILQEFSSPNLRHSAHGKTMSSGAQPKPIEAQYQDEFYWCFNKTAGRGVPVCTKWSRTADGRVDLWIPGQKWAVEFVREQDQIKEHILWFKKNGQYCLWREDSMIQDWIIVNCTTTSPPTLGKHTPALYSLLAQLI